MRIIIVRPDLESHRVDHSRASHWDAHEFNGAWSAAAATTAEEEEKRASIIASLAHRATWQSAMLQCVRAHMGSAFAERKE
jgi:hypothetical protein